MAETEKTYRVFLSAAEASGDLHCAGLITALKQSSCSIEFVGVGGAKMADAGCELLETTVARAAMTYKALSHVVHYYKLIRRITAYLRRNKVDLVIVCDSPAFNFHVAKAAKKAGIRTLFYIAPQLWAWGGWRISKLRKFCDKLCCILPLEQEWFAKRGIDVLFVGNPLMDGLQPGTGPGLREYADFEADKATFAIMPGSRSAEIHSLWPAMQQIAMRIRQTHPQTKFITVAVDAERLEVLKERQVNGFECEYSTDTVIETTHKADFAIVASGSATLQVAAAGCPMVIMYQSSRILWHLIGRWLIRTKFLSLVNILAGEELVPEFMPYFSSTRPVVESIECLVADKEKLARVSRRLIELTEPLGRGSAAEKVAQVAVEMLHQT